MILARIWQLEKRRGDKEVSDQGIGIGIEGKRYSEVELDDALNMETEGGQRKRSNRPESWEAASGDRQVQKR